MISIINQNKSVEHIIRQFRARPNTHMRVIRDHLKLTFQDIRINTDMNSLTANLEGIILTIVRKENQVNVKVDGDLIDSIFFI